MLRGRICRIVGVRPHSLPSPAAISRAPPSHEPIHGPQPRDQAVRIRDGWGRQRPIPPISVRQVAEGWKRDPRRRPHALSASRRPRPLTTCDRGRSGLASRRFGRATTHRWSPIWNALQQSSSAPGRPACPRATNCPHAASSTSCSSVARSATRGARGGGVRSTS